MKTTYTIAVSGTSIAIVPDLTKNDAPDFAAGAVAQGDYVKNPSAGRIYWAIGSGTGATTPSHKGGVVTVDSIEWLCLTPSRELIISADEDVNAYLSKSGPAIVGEGVRLDGSRPSWEIPRYHGPLFAISDGTATLSISHTLG